MKIAASLLKRKYLGIDKETSFLELSQERREDLDVSDIKESILKKLKDYPYAASVEGLCAEDDIADYGVPF